MVNVYKLFLEELNRRNISFVDRYIPYYICSIGAHVFNLINHTKKIYTQAGTTPNMRLHILMVAFPGFGKTFFQKQLLGTENSIVNGTHVKCKFEGDITNASFVGQILTNPTGGDAIEVHGICERRSQYIIGIDEFSSVTNSFKQQYNFGFDTNLLKALDSGDVELARGPGERAYHTDLTLWAGVQPARYDLSSGFSRRFLYLTLYPTLRDLRTLDESRDAMKGVRISKITMDRIKLALNRRVEEINHDITGVYFSDNFTSELKNMKLLHYEKDLLERLAIGYWLMRADNIKGQLFIDLNDELKDIMKREDDFRKEAQMMTPSRIIHKFISSEKTVNEDYVKYTLIKMGMNDKSLEAGFRNLLAVNKIKKEGKDLVILKPYRG